MHPAILEEGVHFYVFSTMLVLYIIPLDGIESLLLANTLTDLLGSDSWVSMRIAEGLLGF